MAVDRFENIYVADRDNSRFQVFDKNGNFLFKYGSDGTSDGQFQNPVGIAVDAFGRVFVSDTTNNDIQRFDTTDTQISTLITPVKLRATDIVLSKQLNPSTLVNGMVFDGSTFNLTKCINTYLVG